MPVPDSSAVANHQKARTDGRTRLSLFLGVVALLIAPVAIGITLLGMIPVPSAVVIGIPALVGVLAVLLGHMARARVRKSAGELKGKGVALTGLIFGYLSLVAIPTAMLAGNILIPHGLVKPAEAVANESDAQSVIHQLIQAEQKYASAFPDQGVAPDLATLGPGPSGNCGGRSSAHACLIDKILGSADCTGAKWCGQGGYRYNLQPAALPRRKPGFCITATPAANSGAKSYCSLDDGIIRYDLSRTPRATPYTARECGSLPPL